MGNDSSRPGNSRPDGGRTLTETEPLPTAGPDGAVTTGMTLGRYRLRERVGEGGMGVVFAAHDPELDRTVAVKVLHPRLGGAGSRGEERLRREGQTMARIAHPNVIRVYDVGAQGDVVFVAMEYVSGGTVKSWLEQAPRSTDQILAVFADAARGLAAAHDAGLVHRDFKPSNVLVSDDGRVLVTDFGVARASLEVTLPDRAPAGGDRFDATVSHAGSLVGTPAYMAPEQLHGRAVDGRADQFSFCVALWRALYGTAPYAGTSWSELAAAVEAGRLVEPRASARVPGHVRAALERGLSPDAARRFPSMRALLQALDPGRRRRRRRRVVLSAVAAVATIAAVGIAVEGMSRDPCASRVDRFAGVWDAAARAAVHGAFRATGVSYAEASFAETARQLDARRAAWEAMRRHSCEATRVRKEQSDSMFDARASCLDRSFADVAAFVDVLRHADPTVVRGAAQTAATVGDVAPCGDVTALGRRAPLPSDPSQRRKIDAVESELAALRARVAAGRYGQAEPDADRLIERARATGYAPVLADALTLAGSLQEKLMHGQVAEKLFDEALLAAEAGGDDNLRFDDEVHLVNVVGYVLERDADGHEHAQRAQALLQRLGTDRQREARLSRAMASASWWNGHYQKARTEAEHAVALQEAIDPHGFELARALQLYGIILQDLKLDDASLPPLERARTLAEATVGVEHPSVAQIRLAIGGSLRHLGRYDEAEREYLASLTTFQRMPGSPELAGALQNLGTLYLDERKLDEAIRCLRRGADQMAHALGADHSRVGDVLEILGSAYSKAGRAAEAEATLNRAIAIHRARLGPNAPPTATSLRELGSHFLRVGQPARAVPSFEEAVRALIASQGDHSPLLARPLAGLGDAELALGQRSRARDAYARAIAVVPDDKSQAGLRRELEAALDKVSSPHR